MRFAPSRTTKRSVPGMEATIGGFSEVAVDFQTSLHALNTFLVGVFVEDKVLYGKRRRSGMSICSDVFVIGQVWGCGQENVILLLKARSLQCFYSNRTGLAIPVTGDQ